ncbi:MAG: hypothetical protein VX343_03595 [Thermodesulfobacteriota bacterium]|nr:hypothetical protein [Thermodesulfobacteriota bacterium]
MFLNLLASFFFSNKVYMAASLNRHYIPGKRALLIVLLATFLDDIAYYCFDSKYALSNFSFIFYFFEIILTCFVVALISRVVGCSARQCTFGAIFKGYSYTLSPVIIGSVIIILLSVSTNWNDPVSNPTSYKVFYYSTLLVLMVWMFACQYIFFVTYFTSLRISRRVLLFLISTGIYFGIDKFKKSVYLFLSGSQ